MHEHVARMKDVNFSNSLQQTVRDLDTSRPVTNGTEAHPMITCVNNNYSLLLSGQIH